jgi:hypothetical protein
MTLLSKQGQKNGPSGYGGSRIGRVVGIRGLEGRFAIVRLEGLRNGNRAFSVLALLKDGNEKAGQGGAGSI